MDDDVDGVTVHDVEELLDAEDNETDEDVVKLGDELWEHVEETECDLDNDVVSVADPEFVRERERVHENDAVSGLVLDHDCDME